VIVLDVIHYSNDVAEMIQKIIENVSEKAIYMGWSLGGMLATNLALTYPEKVRSVITFASNQQFVANSQWSYGLEKNIFDAFYQSLEKDIEENTNNTLRQFIALITQGDQQQREQRRFLKPFLQSTRQSPESLLMGLQLLGSVNNTVENLPVPNHHFFGEHDVLVPSEAAYHIATEEAVTIVPGAGHLLHSPLGKTSALIGGVLRQWSEND